MRTAVFITLVIVWGMIAWLLLVLPLVQRWKATEGARYLLQESDAASWWGTLRVSFSGIKRKLLTRFIWLVGLLLSVHQLLLPHLTILQPLIPVKYQPLVIPLFTIVGVALEVMMRISPQPVDEVNPDIIAAQIEKPVEYVLESTAADPAIANVSPTQAQSAVTPVVPVPSPEAMPDVETPENTPP